jgi:AICAR transformylase/IMP cyclohydrolase PurH
MKYIQEQASPDEAEELLKTGYWPWSEETKNEYKDAVSHNKMIKVDPGEALDDAMKVYNETAAKRLLSWNTKEGHFLIYGSNDGKSTFQCSEDKHGNNVMRKNTLEGYNLWNGYKNEKNTTISSDNMENEIPGFIFVKNKCNPCGPLNDEPDYSCPFKLNVNGDDKISPVWENLWGLK